MPGPEQRCHTTSVAREGPGTRPGSRKRALPTLPATGLTAGKGAKWVLRPGQNQGDHVCENRGLGLPPPLAGSMLRSVRRRASRNCPQTHVAAHLFFFFAVLGFELRPTP
jgi:hypothetical protein